MHITLTQIFLAIFLFFALSRVVLRFRGGEISLKSFFFWILLFGSAIITVLWPGITGGLAETLGVGRGADVVLYTSIVLIFYLIFRIYVYIQDLRHEISNLTKKLAIKELITKNEKKSTED